MDETTEPTLLAALADAPGDDATRTVYADWLEQHGHRELARFVRGEEVARRFDQISDGKWRSITSRARVACQNERCPGTWDRFAPTERDRIRACAVCARYPVYCLTPTDAVNAGRRKHPAAFDAPAAAELQQAFDYEREPWKYGSYNPPPPGSYRVEPQLAPYAAR